MATKSKPKPPDSPDPKKISFEKATEELDRIIECIESGEIGLQESLSQRKRGDDLIKRCRQILDQAEQELKTISAKTEKKSQG